MGADLHLHDPQTLYRQWEAGQWNPFDIDLAADREQWGQLAGEARDLVFWALCSLMVAEERITTQFAGLVLAADSEEEASFAATQQVDEARHMQHYARFQDQVIGDPQSIARHVARARRELGESFEAIFDEALVGAHERLVANPRDRAAKVDFVTTYHLIIESTLGLTAFRFITRYLERGALLPGFVHGYRKIHGDEQRHIAYGVWFLREAILQDGALADRVRATLRELLPAVASALSPADRGGADFDALGASTDEIRQFALTGLRRRLSVIGVPLETLSSSE